jgi:hypothetical protein
MIHEYHYYRITVESVNVVHSVSISAPSPPPLPPTRLPTDKKCQHASLLDCMRELELHVREGGKFCLCRLSIFSPT